MTTQSQSEACPSCGAEVVGGRTICWLCGERIGSADKVPQRQGIGVPQELRQPNAKLSASELVQILAMILVFVGVALQAPGVGIAFAIVARPPLARTIIVAKRRDELQQPVSPSEQIASFFDSVLAISLVLCVVVCTAVATFLASCVVLQAGDESFGVRSGPYGLPNSTVVLMAFAIAVVGASAAGWTMFLWARKRWDRDVYGQ